MFSYVWNEAGASRSARRMVAGLERAIAGGKPPEWSKLVRRIPEGEEWELMDWARRGLDALPVPLSAEVPDEHAHERGVLERFIAEIYLWEGNPEPMIQVLRRAHLHRGEPALELLLLLANVGRDMEAWVLADRALAAGTDDIQAIRALQARLAAVPVGWTEAVEQLAQDPTREAWEALLAFVPDDNIFFTIKHTLHLLVDLGADPDAIFEAAAPDGASSALLELVESGLVDPEVVVRHAERTVLPSLWTALAARAAWARGEEERCVELAARAVRLPGAPELAAIQLASLWEWTSDALREALTEVGVKRAIEGVLPPN